ncbi:hypothetical protein A2U01_0055545, partial [Trifolium medium]|nr:hypothetical protein [Trifolium medium]
FLKEQAALSAADITTEAVNDFVSDSDGDSDSEKLSNGSKHKMGRILLNGVEISTSERSETVLQSKNGSAWTPKVNGKHNKHVHHVNLKGKGDMMLQGNHV